jgi:hypothetical protein
MARSAVFVHSDASTIKLSQRALLYMLLVCSRCVLISFAVSNLTEQRTYLERLPNGC